MITILYNLILFIWAVCLFPRVLLRSFKQKKALQILKQRLGWLQLPFLGDKENKIWIHAVSLGETKAVIPLIQKIKQENPQAYIIFSTLTPVGLEEAQKHAEIDHVFVLPIDFSWIMKKLVKKISPRMFVLVETDFWFNLLKNLKKEGTYVSLVNGKISPASYKRFRSLKRFSEALFSYIDDFCVQDETHKKRFLSLQIPENKIFVTGNLKFDSKKILDSNITIETPKNKKIITIASTHENEEEMIIKALGKTQEDVCLLIAPRRPERFTQVASLLKKKKISFQKLSEQKKEFSPKNVILIDQMGVLDSCFQISDVAIVGGSFVRHIGGHNIYEPIRYGVPVIYGPYMHKQEDLVSSLQEHGVGEQIQLEQLENTITKYLEKEHVHSYDSLEQVISGATLKSFNRIKEFSLGK